MPLCFRTAGPADIPLLRDLAERIWRTAYPGMIGLEQIEYMLGWMYSAETIAEELAAGVHWELVLLDETPIGYLSVSTRPTAELHKLYLLPEFHGRGFGQAMIAHAIERASARGSCELRLRVNKGNSRALRSYERAGFRIVEALASDIGGGFVMDDYILARAIP